MLLRIRACNTKSCYIVILIRKLLWGRPLLLTSTKCHSHTMPTTVTYHAVANTLKCDPQKSCPLPSSKLTPHPRPDGVVYGDRKAFVTAFTFVHTTPQNLQ